MTTAMPSEITLQARCFCAVGPHNWRSHVPKSPISPDHTTTSVPRPTSSPSRVESQPTMSIAHHQRRVWDPSEESRFGMACCPWTWRVV